MWSHTIKSTAQKSTNPPAERPAGASNNLRKKDDPITTPEEDMDKEFDADGFSRTSKVHPYKKPLTVAKTPSFGRTTSRTGQTATSGTDLLRKDSQTKSTQPVKPTQTSKTGTPARVPRTATPTLSSPRAAKAGIPLKDKPPVTSPRRSESDRRPTNSNSQNGVQSPSSENTTLGLNTHKPGEPGETPAKDDHSKDGNNSDDLSRANDLLDHQGSEGLKHIAVKDGKIRDLQVEIQRLQTTKDSEIKELQAQIENIKTTSEQRDEEIKTAHLAQMAPLESEIADTRKKFSDIEATHRKTQEEYNRSLSAKDEEIQRLSQAAQERRREQEAKESALSLKSEFQRLQNQHKRELDEASVEASLELEAVRVERDGLIQSRDKEIKKMGDLVQELQEKVEKAHQADKDELKEARRVHEQELNHKVQEHVQELRDVNTKHEQALRHEALQYEQKLRDAATRYEELQQMVPQLEQELRDAAAKHVQDTKTAKEERESILRDTTERHDQESRDTALKYQKEVEDLMLTHQEEIKAARTRNEQASEDSAAQHQLEIEALIAKHKEELEAAAARQEQALGAAAAKYQQESQSLESKHLEELRVATNRDEQDSGILSAKHQQEVRAMTAKHQEELENIITTNEHNLDNAAARSQQAIEAMVAKHRDELANATLQTEELQAVIQKHQQDLGDLATTHGQELERVTLKHQQELREVTTKYEQDLEEAEAKYRELESGSLAKGQTIREAAQSHEEEAVGLQNQLETAINNVASLESAVRDLNLQAEKSSREAALQHEQELRTATLEYEQELQSLRKTNATASEEIAALRQTLEDVEQKQREAVEEELQSLRIIYATAVEEITALRRKVEALDQKRSEAVDEVALLRASLDDLDLKGSEGQLTSLQGIAKDEKLEQSEAAVEIALLRDKLELADRRFEQDQQAVSDLQRQTRGLQARIDELSTDENLDQTEAAVDAALFKDKLELADLEIHLHKGTISALQNKIERLEAQRAEDSPHKNLDRDEAVVDVALLKDKLQLANIQIRQAKGTVSNLQEEIEGLKVQITDSTVGMDLDQNEAAVGIALLKNALELANTESHQDKATITTLRKQIEVLQAQVADTPKAGLYMHHQLRDELSMLERNHAAQMADLESLKADMAAESELGEQAWRKRVDVWDNLASELQGMKTQLVGTVGGNH